MKNRQLTIKASLIMIFLLGSFQNISAQNDKEETIYNWFDSVLGKENLDINNGTLHHNYDRTFNNEHRYYDLNAFVNGSVVYNDQNYYDLALKYDIYNDEVVLNPKNKEANYIIINLSKEMIKSFRINKKNFVNLTLSALPSNVKKGYYEENLVGKSFTFYVKHYKFKKETLQNTRPLLNYFYQPEFLLFYNNNFLEINSRRDLTNLFPIHKTKIDEFYSKYEKLEEESKLKFMEKLMIYIDTLLKSESN